MKKNHLILDTTWLLETGIIETGNVEHSIYIPKEVYETVSQIKDEEKVGQIKRFMATYGITKNNILSCSEEQLPSLDWLLPSFDTRDKKDELVIRYTLYIATKNSNDNVIILTDDKDIEAEVELQRKENTLFQNIFTTTLWNNIQNQIKEKNKIIEKELENKNIVKARRSKITWAALIFVSLCILTWYLPWYYGIFTGMAALGCVVNFFAKMVGSEDEHEETEISYSPVMPVINNIINNNINTTNTKEGEIA